MKVYKKKWKQEVCGSLDEVWNFFSRPENLNKLTPSNMKFEIISDVEGVEMTEGMLIRYKVSPYPFLKMNWLTEITEIVKGKYFIDEQREGPYSLWRHRHSFRQLPGKVLMEDELEYALPLGILGRIVNKIEVSRKIDQIFEFRYSTVEGIFGTP